MITNTTTTLEKQKTPETVTASAQPKRQTDQGAKILPDMQHFVHLARRIKSKQLLDRLFNALGTPVTGMAEIEGESPTHERLAMFGAIAAIPETQRQRLERAAERIMLLCNDSGCEAVKSVLTGSETDMLLETDKAGRALYLFLRLLDSAQTVSKDKRFEQAEETSRLAQQSKSEEYASHFHGPRGIEPILDEALEERLKDAIAAIYPEAPREDMLVEQFVCREVAYADRGTDQDGEDAIAARTHTLVVNFNGRDTNYDKIVSGLIITKHDLALLRVVFRYEPHTGAVSVFTERKEVRRELAGILRDVVLAGSGEIADLPMREFDLTGFAHHEMLAKLSVSGEALVEHVTVNQLKVAREFRQAGAAEDSKVQELASHLTVQRDRRDRRTIYTVAYEDYGVDDFKQLKICQVKLVIRIGKQSDRRAHNINVQITAPNGLNDNARTEADRQLMMRLLKKWGIVHEF